VTVATIEAPVGVDMAISSPIRHLCPVVNEVDNGTVRIAWTTDGDTLELHSLAAYIGNFEGVTISHEELADAIHSDLSYPEGIAAVRVALDFETAGMAVTAEMA
jgi:NADPH-dependent 7-cyano-7-deazaguanine reductase QueF